MTEQDSSKGSGSGLTIIFLIALIAGGWYYFQNLQGEGPADSKSALAAQEKMREMQKQAEATAAPVQAAETFRKGLEAGQRGEQEFGKGNYTAARNHYNSAIGFFQASIAEAIPKTGEKVTDTQRESASSAQKAINNLQSEAEKAGARTLAATDFNAAMRAMQQGDQKFKEDDYVAAVHAYQQAGGFFRTSRDKANTERLKGMENVGMMKGVVESIRQEMRQEKAAAEQAKSEIWANEMWGSALEKEQTGDVNFRKGDKIGYLAAQTLYSDAKDKYRMAKEQADKAAIADMNSRAIANKTAQLKNDAEAARSAMTQAKRNTPGNASEKEANANYQKASGKEAEGETSFRAGNYQSAKVSFQEAVNLYDRAAEEIRLTISKKEDVIDTEAAKRERAESDIRDLITRFEQSLKGGDVVTLATFKEGEKGWREFFNHVRDVKAFITNEDNQIFLESNSARVSFKVNMSYRMEGSKEIQREVLTRRWDLRLVNGKWVIVTSIDK